MLGTLKLVNSVGTTEYNTNISSPAIVPVSNEPGVGWHILTLGLIHPDRPLNGARIKVGTDGRILSVEDYPQMIGPFPSPSLDGTKLYAMNTTPLNSSTGGRSGLWEYSNGQWTQILSNAEPGWYSHVFQMADGKLYSSPYSGIQAVWEFDGNQITVWGPPLTLRQAMYFAVVANRERTKFYALPYRDETRILKIDIINKTVEPIGPVFPSGIVKFQAPASYPYYLGANNKIYIAPADLTQYVEIDPETDTVRLLHSTIYDADTMFVGMTSVYHGELFVSLPNSASGTTDRLLIYNPILDTWVTTASTVLFDSNYSIAGTGVDFSDVQGLSMLRAVFPGYKTLILDYQRPVNRLLKTSAFTRAKHSDLASKTLHNRAKFSWMQSGVKKARETEKSMDDTGIIYEQQKVTSNVLALLYWSISTNKPIKVTPILVHVSKEQILRNRTAWLVKKFVDIPDTNVLSRKTHDVELDIGFYYLKPAYEMEHPNIWKINFDEYQLQQSLQKLPQFATMIVARLDSDYANRVVDNEDALVTTMARIAPHSLKIKYHVPSFYTLKKLKVVLMPPREIIKDSIFEDESQNVRIDITEWLRVNGWIKDDYVLIPHEIVIHRSELRLVKLHNAELIRISREWYILPWDYYKVYFAYELSLNEDNPLINRPFAVSSQAELERILGPVTPRTYVQYGALLYLKWFNNPVGILITDDIPKAVEQIKNIKRVYNVAVFESIDDDSLAERLNEITTDSHQVVFTGFKPLNLISSLTEKKTIKEMLRNFIIDLTSPHLRVFLTPEIRLNDVNPKSKRKGQIKLPGFVYGVIYGGLVQKDMAKPISRLTDLTNTVHQQAMEIYPVYPVPEACFFDELTKNELSNLGYTYLYTYEGIRLSHVTTCSRYSPVEHEDVFMRTIDYISYLYERDVKPRLLSIPYDFATIQKVVDEFFAMLVRNRVIYSYQLKFVSTAERNLRIDATIWLTPGIRYIVIGFGL